MGNPYDNTRNRNSSVLGPTLKFKGELTADEDLLIQGHIDGSIKHSSSLTIGESGHVKADVSAEYISVEGTVTGDLRGSKCVKVRETATVGGNIVSPNVSLVEGATFNGKIDMDSDPAVQVAKTPEKNTRKDAVATTEKSEAEKTEAEKRSNTEKRRSAKKPAHADKKSADAA